MSDLTLLQADALRELCNICGGHAATALSRLLGDARVELELPQVERLPRRDIVERLGGPEHQVVAARVQLDGPVTGELVLALSDVDAAELTAAVTRGVREDAFAHSAFGEAANIVASACLNALFRLTHLTVLPGVPLMARGPAAELLEQLLPRRDDEMVVMSTVLFVSHLPVRGRLLVVPNPTSLTGLLEAMGVAA
jgi:chemotaxis protein CheC